jgi:hypothetical protein
MSIFVSSVGARSSNQPSDCHFSFLGVCQSQTPSYQNSGTLYLYPDVAAEFSHANITDCKV